MVYTCLYKPTFRWWLIQPIYADSGDGWLLILLGLPHESFGLGWNRWKFRCCKSCKSQACPPGRYAPEAATPQCQADIHADVYTVYIYNFFYTHIIMIYIMMYIASHWLFNLWYPLVISLWSMLVSQPARLPVGSHWVQPSTKPVTLRSVPFWGPVTWEASKETTWLLHNSDHSSPCWGLEWSVHITIHMM